MIEEYDRNEKKFNKLESLQRECMSDNNLWVHVGAVFNVFMRPLWSGPIMIIPSYSCSNNGLTGTDAYSALRKNMIVIYDTNSRCIQKDDVNVNLKDLTIKVTKREIQLMAPNMTNLILNMDNFTVTNDKCTYCETSFRERIFIYLKIKDCGNVAAAWISEYLNKPNLALGYVIPEEKSERIFWHEMRKIYLLYQDERNIVIFPKILPHFTLISYRSYLEVNKLLSCPVTLDKYNVDICIVPLDAKPFAELEWEWFQIGDIVLRNITPWKNIKINMKDMPIEMKMKMIVLDCELYQSGTMQTGDEVYVRQPVNKLELDKFEYNNSD